METAAALGVFPISTWAQFSACGKKSSLTLGKSDRLIHITPYSLVDKLPLFSQPEVPDDQNVILVGRK